jgi:hypothetical protein
VKPSNDLKPLFKRFGSGQVIVIGGTGESGLPVELQSIPMGWEIAKETDADDVRNAHLVYFWGGITELPEFSSIIDPWFRNLNEGGVVVCQVSGGTARQRLNAYADQHDLAPFINDGRFYLYRPDSRLMSFRRRHRGHRVFLLGNGPSLNKTNLDLIKREYSIAMNRIALIYSRTDWRPTYYLYTADNINNRIWGDKWRESVNQAVAEASTTSFVWDIFKDKVKDNPRIHWTTNVTEGEIATEGTFSTNAAQWISKTGTSMNVAYQLAFHMGFSEIYILGCDLNWRTSIGTGRDPNHFDTAYSARIPNGEVERARMRRVHVFAGERLGRAGVKVFNATSNTLLDVFPVVDFEKVASGVSGSSLRTRISQDALKNAILSKWYWSVSRPIRFSSNRWIRRAVLSMQHGPVWVAKRIWSRIVS